MKPSPLGLELVTRSYSVWSSVSVPSSTPDPNSESDILKQVLPIETKLAFYLE